MAETVFFILKSYKDNNDCQIKKGLVDKDDDRLENNNQLTKFQ